MVHLGPSEQVTFILGPEERNKQDVQIIGCSAFQREEKIHTLSCGHVRCVHRTVRRMGGWKHHEENSVTGNLRGNC